MRLRGFPPKIGTNTGPKWRGSRLRVKKARRLRKIRRETLRFMRRGRR